MQKPTSKVGVLSGPRSLMDWVLSCLAGLGADVLESKVRNGTSNMASVVWRSLDLVHPQFLNTSFLIFLCLIDW